MIFMLAIILFSIFRQYNIILVIKRSPVRTDLTCCKRD